MNTWTPFSVLMLIIVGLPSLTAAIIGIIFAAKGNSDAALKALQQQVTAHDNQIHNLALNAPSPTQGKPNA